MFHTRMQANPCPPSPVSKLQAALEPSLLKVSNDSHKHDQHPEKHHAKEGSATADTGETHLR